MSTKSSSPGSVTKSRAESRSRSSKHDRLLEQGLDFHKQGLIDEAAQIYADVLSRDPKHPGALHLLGVLFFQSGDAVRAVHLISQAAQFEPKNPVFLLNLGNALQASGQFARAEESFRRAILLREGFAEAYNNLGNALVGLYRLDEAIKAFSEAISINSNEPEPYNNRGNALRALGSAEAALTDFQEAIRLRPNYVDAHSNLGYTLIELNQFEGAIKSFESTIRIDPQFEYVRGALVFSRLRVCDWKNYQSQVDLLLADLSQRGAKCVPPWAVLSMTDSLLAQRRAAEIWAANKHPLQNSLGALPDRDRSPDERICVGYYSADFYEHATAYLIAEILELHDRHRFRIVLFNFGPVTGDAMQRRLKIAADSFFDVSDLSDSGVAALSRSTGVGIAIDLKGFTQNQRAGIFANRAAPIQINFLGYPGTMGADYIDYIIADRELIPEASRPFYTEKVIYLPGSYQPNDRKRTISAGIVTRSEYGLPDEGFVYSCFNNNFKINPEVFDAWVEILKNVPHSVLWLLADNPSSVRNLRLEAESRGLPAERLVFAPRVPLANHLARHSLADLFLDTWPCNAHTTASDALWAGLPVLTLRGESFAARVGASLLRAVDLPELIMDTRDGYVSEAIELGRNPALVTALKERLNLGRMTAPLFDSVSYIRKLEAAYLGLMEE
jgi:predicted O-linked N-acetylglucosamine transferase (SPINDLY family)